MITMNAYVCIHLAPHVSSKCWHVNQKRDNKVSRMKLGNWKPEWSKQWLQLINPRFSLSIHFQGMHVSTFIGLYSTCVIYELAANITFTNAFIFISNINMKDISRISYIYMCVYKAESKDYLVYEKLLFSTMILVG